MHRSPTPATPNSSPTFAPFAASSRLRALALALSVGLISACGGDADGGAGSAAGGAPGPGAVVGVPDGTDIWVFELFDVVGGGITLEGARNITGRPGYDNQPMFNELGHLLFTQGEGERTDLWRWDPNANIKHRITLTSDESEYSATPIPGAAGTVSYIKVEADSTQRLWRINEDGSSAHVLVPNLAPVGYHAWLDEQNVAMYVLADEDAGTPSTLQIGRLPAGAGTAAILSAAPEVEVRVKAENIGRSLQTIPGRAAVSFTQARGGASDAGADGVGLWTIFEYDLERDRVTRIADLPEGTQDHAWTPSGDLITAVGGSFYQRRDGDWQLIADWSRLGQTFSRIAVDRDGVMVAVVGEPVGG